MAAKQGNECEFCGDDPCICGLEEDGPDLKCPKCNGSGNEMEGWPCEFCEGLGTLDI